MTTTNTIYEKIREVESDPTTDTNEVSLTPRTDAFNNTLGVVPADFARGLERELTTSLQNQVKAEGELQDFIQRQNIFGEALSAHAYERAERAEAEVERLKEEYEAAAESVARMHEAAVGEIRGPSISVIDDIKAVRERAEKADAEVERLGGLLFETRSLLTEFYDCMDIGGLHDGDCNISTEDPEKWEQGCNCTTADLRRKYIKLYSK